MRLLTTSIVALICLVAVVRGWSIVEFSIARMHHDGGLRERVATWRGTTGLAAEVDRYLLKQASSRADADDVQWRIRELSDVLAVEPLSSIDWLSLAGARRALGEPDEQVLAALKMSYLTGPNEGAVMLQRGVFGLLEWERLPNAMQLETARDLAGAIDDVWVSEQSIGVIKTVLLAKSAETRSQIAAMLEMERLSKDQAARLGL